MTAHRLVREELADLVLVVLAGQQQVEAMPNGQPKLIMLRRVERARMVLERMVGEERRAEPAAWKRLLHNIRAAAGLAEEPGAMPGDTWGGGHWDGPMDPPHYEYMETASGRAREAGSEEYRRKVEEMVRDILGRGMPF